MFEGPFFHESVYRSQRPAAEVLDKLAERGILGGVDLSGDYPELGEGVLVCATEMRGEGEAKEFGCELAAIFVG